MQEIALNDWLRQMLNSAKAAGKYIISKKMMEPSPATDRQMKIFPAVCTENAYRAVTVRNGLT
jgi:hypothetical protein